MSSSLCLASGSGSQKVLRLLVNKDFAFWRGVNEGVREWEPPKTHRIWTAPPPRSSNPMSFRRFPFSNPFIQYSSRCLPGDAFLAPFGSPTRLGTLFTHT